MNVSLTPELEKSVADKVATGRYTSASEVVREALRLFEREENSRKEQSAEFNRELQSRLDSLKRGEEFQERCSAKKLPRNWRAAESAWHE